MMLSLRAVLLAVLAAGLLQIDAQAQVPDRTALLPPAADAVDVMPTEAGEPVPENGRHGELTLQTGRDSEIVLGSSARSSLACSLNARWRSSGATRPLPTKWCRAAVSEDHPSSSLAGCLLA